MKVFLAGPPTDYDEFEHATIALRGEGFEVASPHEIAEEYPDPCAYAKREVDEALNADAVALLDGWEGSPSAVVGVLTAASQGKPARVLRAWLAGVAATVAAIVGGVTSSPAISSETDRGDRKKIEAQYRAGPDRLPEWRRERRFLVQKREAAQMSRIERREAQAI